MNRSMVISLMALLTAAAPALADEVDDILNLRAKNRDRVKKFSAEFLMETKQPKTLKNPKTLRMRYRMKLERLPKEAKAPEHNPWLMEAEVLEPLPMKLKVKGDQAWFLDQRRNWIELPMTLEIREQFLKMGERMLGGGSESIRKNFEVKLLRKNGGIFLERTRTLQFEPKGARGIASRIEEDISGAGLPVETRMYDESGHESSRVKVTRRRRIGGIEFPEETEASGGMQGFGGKVITYVRNIEIEVDREGERLSPKAPQ